jgi:hypothetical protein
MKKIIILAIAMLLASSAFADRRSMKDQTEMWLQSEKTEETSSVNLRISPPPPPPTVPVGEGFLFLLACAGMYSLKLKNSKK